MFTLDGHIRADTISYAKGVISLCEACFAAQALFTCGCGNAYFCSIECMYSLFRQDHYGRCPTKTNGTVYQSHIHTPARIFSGHTQTHKPLKVLMYATLPPLKSKEMYLAADSRLCDRSQEQPGMRYILAPQHGRAAIRFTDFFQATTGMHRHVRSALESYVYTWPKDKQRSFMDNVCMDNVWLVEVDQAITFGGRATPFGVMRQGEDSNRLPVRFMVENANFVPIGVIAPMPANDVSTRVPRSECVSRHVEAVGAFRLQRYDAFWFPAPAPISTTYNVKSELTLLQVTLELQAIGHNLSTLPIRRRRLERRRGNSRFLLRPPELKTTVTVSVNDEEDDDRCCVCLSYRPCVELLPCGHADFCNECVTVLVDHAEMTGHPLACPLDRCHVSRVVVYEDEDSSSDDE